MKQSLQSCVLHVARCTRHNSVCLHVLAKVAKAEFAPLHNFSRRCLLFMAHHPLCSILLLISAPFPVPMRLRPSVNTQSPAATTPTSTPDRNSGYVTDTALAPVARPTTTMPTSSTRATSNRLSAAALPPTRDSVEIRSSNTSEQQLLQGWLQRDVTGVQAEKALRGFGEGRFCVRKSTSSADCVVLSLMGPSNVVHHYQFKKVSSLHSSSPSWSPSLLLSVPLKMMHHIYDLPHSITAWAPGR